MTIQEKRSAYRAALLSRERKNQYSQLDHKRLLIESGWGDCSSTPYYWLKKLFYLDIGDYTEAQLESSAGKQVEMNIQNGLPDEKQMEIGDHLYFRGNDDSRTQGVGHVEIYIGNGKCFGHGSGLGGTVKDLSAYCAKRQATPSRSTVLKNKGLICVRRFLFEDPSCKDEIQAAEISAENEITKFQSWLNARLSIGLTIDGRCGPQTKKAAVMAMQKYLNSTYDAGLAVDGSFGPASRRAYRTVCRGVQGPLVFIIQGLLYGHGLNPQGFDGHCGAGCESAIRQFQKANQLKVDGRCGPATFTALTNH